MHRFMLRVQARLLKKQFVAPALLLGSYLVASFVNAAPIDQPALKAPFRRSAVLMIVPTPQPEPAVEYTPTTPRSEFRRQVAVPNELAL
jgi:hypothetical protein